MSKKNVFAGICILCRSGILGVTIYQLNNILIVNAHKRHYLLTHPNQDTKIEYNLDISKK